MYTVYKQITEITATKFVVFVVLQCRMVSVEYTSAWCKITQDNKIVCVYKIVTLSLSLFRWNDAKHEC